MTHNITSPVVCTMSMPDPRDSRYAQTPEVTNYTILALTCMRNKYLGSTDLPKLEDMKVIEAVVNSISDNLSITRPHKIGNIVFGLRPNFDPSMPLNHNQQRIHQLYQIIECASLTSVI